MLLEQLEVQIEVPEPVAVLLPLPVPVPVAQDTTVPQLAPSTISGPNSVARVLGWSLLLSTKDT